MDAVTRERHRRQCGDGYDNDCRGGGDVACGDLDGDGFLSGVDCNDDDPSVNPSVVEICGNAIDENCDGVKRCDQDRDGVFDDLDCDDLDPDRYPKC